MEKIQKIDEWLITQIFEPVSWWIEYHTRYSHLRVAQALLLGCAFGAFSLLQTLADMGGDYEKFRWILFSLYIAPVFFFFVVYEFFDRILSQREMQNLFRLEWEARLPLIPIFVVCITIGSIIGHDVGGFATYAACLFFAWFFAACNRMPPSYKEKKDEKIKLPIQAA